MKLNKKLLLTVLVPASLIGTVSCNKSENNVSNSGFETTIVEQTNKNNFSLTTDEGYARLNSEPTDQSTVDAFIDTIISKGGEAIMGGVQVYAKYIVLNLLKECGLDFRDATTKTLEKMQQQLGIIETKIDAIAAKQAQYHSEDVLNKVLDQYATANARYMDYVTGSLAYLAGLENDGTLSDDEIEIKRQRAYEDGINLLMIDGAPFATYVTDLANKILLPNQSDARKDIFFYYDNTIGLTDRWSIQHYRNVKNFIAYIDSTLVLLSNLAKFQIYYKYKDADDAMRLTYSKMIDAMALSVNSVNTLFAAKLDELAYVKDEWNQGLNKYLPTNEFYGTRIATLTYNLNEGLRQALTVGYYNDYKVHGCHQVAYCYQPNTDIVDAVANDFKDFAGDYCSSSYTIQDYLDSAGFYAANDDLYRKAAGLFYGNMFVDKHGYMHDDFDYTISYYDKQCNFTRTNAYEVASYHTWWGGIDHTELRENDTNYYLCFSRKYGACNALDGAYKQTYMWDSEFTVEEAVALRYHFKEFINSPGPITFRACW